MADFAANITIEEGLVTEFVIGFLRTYPMPHDWMEGEPQAERINGFVKLRMQQWLQRVYESGVTKKAGDEVSIIEDIVSVT